MEIREASFTKEEFYEVVNIIQKHKDVAIINPNGMVPGVWTVETKVGFIHYLEGGGGYDHWIAMTKNASNPYDIFIDDSNLIYLASDIYARKLEEKGTGSMSFVKRILCGLPLEDEGDDVIGKVMQDFVEENPLLHAANAVDAGVDKRVANQLFAETYRSMVGKRYRHFKGGIYIVDAIAVHSETSELRVIYHTEDNPTHVWDRDLNMFLSPVDKEKYPDVEQNERFKLID